MTGRVHSDAGFTLVEALVSLFVFGLIASGCVMLLMQGVESQRRVSEAHAALRELQTARALLSSDLAQLAARKMRMPDNAYAPAFLGGGEAGLAFVRASAEADPERAALTALTHVAYVVDGDRLVRRSRRDLDPLAGGAATDRIVFAHAEDVRFEFFDGAQWRTNWGEGAPPRAVALLAKIPRYGEVRIEAATGLGR
jgi:general secretion pathway protein J